VTIKTVIVMKIGEMLLKKSMFNSLQLVVGTEY
jgi:hypothetical protein